MKKNGFTLAEVLITIGIIGVIAAITLTNLIKNCQKTIWTNQLKKEYTLLSNGFKKMLADDDVFDLSQTEVFSAINSTCKYTYTVNSQQCANFYDNLKKYFNIIDIHSASTNYKISRLDNSSKLYDPITVIYLKDGSTITNYSFSANTNLNASNAYPSCEDMNEKGGKLCYTQGSFYIDINGEKKPNKMGRDVFSFYLSNDGNIYPYGGKDVAISIIADHLTWETHYRYCGKTDKKFTAPVDGNGCAARIIEEGWKMNY